MTKEIDKELELLKLKTIYTCPKCNSRTWQVVQYGSDEPLCECIECGWDCDKDLRRKK